MSGHPVTATSSSIERMKTAKPWKAPKIKNEGSTDELYEMENQFILRLPEKLADRVKKILEENYGESLKNNLALKFEPDMRTVTMKLDKRLYHGKMMDLPCIIENLKTFDRKNFYKVANVSQMAVMKDEAEVVDEPEPENPKKKEKQFQYPHGLTPPLKNVRKRRFRKTLKKKNLDAPELDRELKRLLRSDLEAMSIQWEVVEELIEKAPAEPNAEGEPQAAPTTKKTTTVVESGSSDTIRKAKENVARPREFCFSKESLDDSDIRDLSDETPSKTVATSTVPAPSSSEKNSSAEKGKRKLEKAEGEKLPQFKIPTLNTDAMGQSDSTAQAQSVSGIQFGQKESESAPKPSTPTPPEREPSPDPNQMLILEVEKELSSIVKKRKKMEADMKSLDNAFLKERMQEDLDHILVEEKKKREELDLLKGNE